MLAETDLKALKDPTLFSFWSSVSVRFSDLDPNNHVNNAVTLSYIETARLGIRSAVLNELDDETKNLSWVVVAQSIAYFQPISYPSEVKIGCFEIERIPSGFNLKLKNHRMTKGSAVLGLVQIHTDLVSRYS